MTFSRRWAGLVFVAFAGIIFCVALAEKGLRMSRRFSNYTEMNEFGEESGRRQAEAVTYPWLWVQPRNAKWVERRLEYTQTIETNSEGLRGRLPDERKGRGEFRVVTLGDSFTSGIGDSEGGGYPQSLERKLRSERGLASASVINGGVPGSDPIFGVELFKRRLLRLQPDLVILTMNRTDLQDVERRGGFDRFLPDGQMRSIPRPAWAWFFDHFHLVRAFTMGWLGYDWWLHSPAERLAAKETVVQRLADAALTLSQSGKENGFSVLVALQPDWLDLRAGKMDGALTEVEEKLKRAGVQTVNLLASFAAEVGSPLTPRYYWPIDGHFTHAGYEVLAEVLERELSARGLLP